MTNDGSASSAVASACAVAGPVVDESWFGSRGAEACLVRMEVPLSAEMMVAALDCAGYFVTAEDVADDGEMWGFAAEVVARGGTSFLEEVAKSLPVLAEQNGRLPAARGASGPEWLAFCRRITEVTGQTEEPADA